MALPLAVYAISALAGAGMGLWSTDREKQKKQEELQRQKDLAWDKYDLGKAYSDQQYGINRTEAHTGLAIQQNRLDEDVDSSVDQFNTGLLAQAYGIQNARIQTASSVGASRAAEGMSGTRGNGANELMRAYEQTSLDRNIDLQYQQNDQALAGMITQANRGMQDISRERASWDTGGYRYESKAAQDAYNLQLANMGQAEYDYAIENAASWEDYALSALSGASSGLSFANSLSGALNLSDWGGGGSVANPADFDMGLGAYGPGYNGYLPNSPLLPIQETPLPGMGGLVDWGNWTSPGSGPTEEQLRLLWGMN